MNVIKVNGLTICVCVWHQAPTAQDCGRVAQERAEGRRVYGAWDQIVEALMLAGV